MKKILETNQNNIKIRKASKKDIDLIKKFIEDLADYEKLSDEVNVGRKLIKKYLFSKSNVAQCLIAEFDKEPAGFAVFFHNFSTFKGKPGLYLEDLFVNPEMRGKGIGKALLIKLAKIAKKRNCARFEWSVLDWNQPAIDFYKSLGAVPMADWTVFRLDEKGINELSKPDKL